MADGQVYDAHTIDSTSPILPISTFSPQNYRSIIQTQIEHTVNRAVDQAVSFSVNGQDGRFLSSAPGQYLKRENDDGYLFHMVGTNRGGDLSVAAP
jgi:hypothetical protein